MGIMLGVIALWVLYFIYLYQNYRKKNRPTPKIFPKPSTANPTALLIGNSLDWVMALLKSQNCIAQTSMTGMQALALCQIQRFNFITLDLMLPDMNGYDLLNKIRATGNGETPIILIVSEDETHPKRLVLMNGNQATPLEKINFLTALQAIGAL